MENTIVLPNGLRNEILDFARRYNEFHPGTLDSINIWLANEEIDSLKHFLNITPIETTISFSCEELAGMSLDELVAAKYRAKQFLPILKKKQELFKAVSYLK